MIKTQKGELEVSVCPMRDHEMVAEPAATIGCATATLKREEKRTNHQQAALKTVKTETDKSRISIFAKFIDLYFSICFYFMLCLTYITIWNVMLNVHLCIC